MRLLLDTHAFLWWLSNDRKLSTAARDAIREPHAIVHVSAASIWEIAIKAKLGRLDVRDSDLVAEIEANGFAELAITARHAQSAGALPRHHDDPRDKVAAACSPSRSSCATLLAWPPSATISTMRSMKVCSTASSSWA